MWWDHDQTHSPGWWLPWTTSSSLERGRHTVVNPHRNHCVPLSRSRLPLSRLRCRLTRVRHRWSTLRITTVCP